MRRLIPPLIVLAVSGCATILVGGCGATIKQYGDPPSAAAVSPEEKVCVRVGADGADKRTRYEGSGRVVAEYVLSVVQQTRPTANLIHPATEADVHPMAAAAGCAYLIVPVIEQWEDRPQWAGRDEVTIELHLMRLDPWTLVRTVTFKQHSGNLKVSSQPASDILKDGFTAAINELLPAPGPTNPVKAVPLR